jgi:hypothetical protein
MTAKQITLTPDQLNRSQIFGWNYSTGVTNTERGWWIDPPTKPYHTGTLNSISRKRQDDRTYQSIKSGNTYYGDAYFIRINGEWRRITTPRMVEILNDASNFDAGRFHSSITVTIE